jgi:hypothetical protein
MSPWRFDALEKRGAGGSPTPECVRNYPRRRGPDRTRIADRRRRSRDSLRGLSRHGVDVRDVNIRDFLYEQPPPLPASERRPVGVVDRRRFDYA